MRLPILLPFAILILSCTSDHEMVTQPPRIDIFDKFTARTIVSESDLPPLPTLVKFFPASREFLVLDKQGEVRHFVLDEISACYLGSITVPEVAPAPEEIGLTGAAFDLDFAQNRFVYFCFSTGDNQWSRIVRYRWSGSYADIEQSLAIVINIDRLLPDEPQHGIYSIGFDSDGNLYAPIGDALQPEYAQDPQTLLGKLIRIRPNPGSQGGYFVPQDNPHLDETGVLPEIAAFGLRTPYRMVIWQDKFYIANVGRNEYEEIELYTLGKANFGWPFCEGYCETGGYEIPVLTVSHADPIYQTEDPESSSVNRLSIGVGAAYAGEGADPYKDLLDGRLIFYDVYQGYVRAAQILPDGRLADDQHIFHLEYITGMDIGPDGYVYGTTLYSPQVFRVEMKIDGM